MKYKQNLNWKKDISTTSGLVCFADHSWFELVDNLFSSMKVRLL